MMMGWTEEKEGKEKDGWMDRWTGGMSRDIEKEKKKRKKKRRKRKDGKRRKMA